MDGIKMSDCEFYVDEEKRTVVCKITDTSHMVHDFLRENCCFSDVKISGTITYRLWSETVMPYSFIGKAVCAPEDEWDEEIGKMIAFARAKEKCYTSFFKRANKIIWAINTRLEQTIDIFNAFGTKLSENKATLEEKINVRIGVEE